MDEYSADIMTKVFTRIVDSLNKIDDGLVAIDDTLHDLVTT